MFALVLAVALAQCTKDTDCKGDRLCVAGVCSAGPTLEPKPLALDEANRLARIAQLKGEIANLKDETETSSLVNPASRALIGAGLVALSVVGLVSWFNWRDCMDHNLSDCRGGDAIGALSLLGVPAGIALFIWGVVQFGMRSRALQELPREISVREEQLRVLEGR